MYSIEVTYDTGDSFHQEYDVKHMIGEVEWKSLKKAKQALKDLEAHYHWYMIIHKEWNVDNNDRKRATNKAKKCAWYSHEYPDFTILLANDDGIRVPIRSCWTGYFDSMTGADIIPDIDHGMSIKIK